MKKRLLLLCATMVFVLAMGGIAAAILVSPSVNLTADETDVDHDNPAVYGNYAVWDSSYEDGWDNNSDIYLQDLSDPAGGFSMITDNGHSYYPNIDNGRVVYTYFNTDLELYEIWMYDIVADEYTLIKNGLSGWEAFPDISGDKVVYRTWDEDQGCDVIMYINLADAVPAAVQISPDNMSCYIPAISGNYVVFEGYDDATGDYRIFLKDLAQLAVEAEAITPDDDSNYFWPNIDGNTVVYEAEDESAVYAYDIDAENAEKISLTGEEADKPDIWGNNVIYSTWADVSGADEWVTFYNRATGYREAVSDPNNFYCPDRPAIWGNKVLYLDYLDQVDEEEYYDSVYFVKLAPTFDTVPGLTEPINVTEGQVITTNPYIIKVYPTAGSEIVRVEFYIDGILIGTSYAPNAEGIWEFPWDTSLYHSLVTAVAYDAAGDSVTISRNTTVLLELPYTGR